ncbi:MAG: DUF6513 domain-containing protein [Phycisphaeraceae bacterium]|nr:DUF6513 domain-containing protein [Phycisphaeraceae bacterium]
MAGDSPEPSATPCVLLVTGTLAEPATRQVAAELRRRELADPVIEVLTIQVAALMTTDWVQRKLELPDRAIDQVILPGYCRGDLEPLADKLGVPVRRGPDNIRDLPELFGAQRTDPTANGEHDLQIIAEINHAPRLTLDDILDRAAALVADGADLIDVGCDPQTDRPAWDGVADTVTALRDAGFRISIDSFHPDEVAAACRAGAELVLSVNSTNADRAADWGAEVVVIPDDPRTLAGLDDAIAQLEADNVAYRIDPIIEPIGFGFAQSLGRYLQVREQYPEAEMMMGIGNLTEMTGVDSAGVNMLLAGFCAEQKIRSVLTTEVINWCRTAVRELDVARRLLHAAIERGEPPKHLSEQLVMLRDARLPERSEEELNELAEKLTDRNVRLFLDHQTGKIHAMHRDAHAAESDPFKAFDQLGITEPSHAFYLGWEMAKAHVARTLGKRYEQDEALDWGMLTIPEKDRHGRRKGNTGD